MLREWEFHMAQLANLGFVPGECHVSGKTTGTPYDFWRDNRRVPADRLHAKLTDAYAAAGTLNGNNNTIFLTPDSHSLDASLTWSKNMTHLVGMYPEARMNMRSRIGMSTTFTPMMLISGYGNLFKNIYWMHGTAATDLVGLHITGNRNTFINCHLNSPTNAALGSEATWKGIHLVTAAENYFKGCTFGNHTIALDEASALLYIGAGNGINVFEDCTFLMRCTDTDPYFIYVSNTADTGMTLFYNCRFIADPGSAGTPAAACEFQNATKMGYLYFDNRCQFVNITNISASDVDGMLRLATTFASTDDDVGFIATTPTIT